MWRATKFHSFVTQIFLMVFILQNYSCKIRHNPYRLQLYYITFAIKIVNII
jgi:hypothetical protein